MTAARWTCPTCRTVVKTNFCSACGERPIRPADLSLAGLAARLAHALTSVDGRLLRTLKCLLRHPGALTVAYADGPRKPYVAPFQLFLFANVLFFAVQSLASTHIFGATLESHLHQQDWSEVAQSLLAQRMEKTHRTTESFAPVFDHAAALNAKTLIIFMAIGFALVLPVAFLGSQRKLMTHVFFALHLYAFLLLLFSASLLVAIVDVLFGGTGLRSATMDNVLSAINFVACMVYLYLAIGPVYGVDRRLNAVRALVLTVLVSALVLGYRFAIFIVTLYST